MKTILFFGLIPVKYLPNNHSACYTIEKKF